MPRMQVSLPDDLCALVKKQKLPASELLQKAVRAEVRHRTLLAETSKRLPRIQTAWPSSESERSQPL